MKRIKDLLAGLSDRHRKDLGKKLMAMAATLAMLGGMAGASTMALADDADAAAAEQAATASASSASNDVSEAAPAAESTPSENVSEGSENPAAEGASAKQSTEQPVEQLVKQSEEQKAGSADEPVIELATPSEAQPATASATPTQKPTGTENPTTVERSVQSDDDDADTVANQNEAKDDETKDNADKTVRLGIASYRGMLKSASSGLSTPEHTKSIEYQGNGAYTLKLDVIGKDASTSTTDTTPIDIALVLDVSGSMNERLPIYSGDLDTSKTYYRCAGNCSDSNPKYEAVTWNASGNSWGYQNGWQWQSITPKSSSNAEYGTQLYDAIKLDALKSAVNSFLDKTDQTNESISEEDKKVQVSLVKFASDKNDSEGNDQTCRTNGSGGYNCTQVVNGLTSDMSSLKTSVKALTASGATQADYAFEKAQEALKKGNRAGVKKYIVFFTDGEPGISGFNDTIANNAISKAKTLKNAGTTVYSIGIFDGANPSASVSSASNANKFMHGISSNYPNATGYRNLGDRASGDYYYSASSATQLAQIFNDIQKTITEKHVYTGVSITDELSEYAKQSGIAYDKSTARTFDGKTFYKVTSGVTLNVTGGKAGETAPVLNTDYALWYSEDGNGIVRAEFNESYELKDGMTYTLSYNVEPTDSAYQTYAKTGYDATGDADTGATSAGKAGFRSNKTAQVCYTTDDRSSCANYRHPVLQIPVANVAVTKEWPDVQPVDGTEVQMHLKGYNDAVDLTVTLNADNQWNDSFVKLAPGEYTLTEDAVDGYTQVGDANVTVTIDKNELWALADKNADLQKPLKTYECTVRNQRNTVTLQDGVKLSKKTQGNDYAESFDFELTDITSDIQKAQNTGAMLKGLEGGKQTTSIGNLQANISKPGAFTVDSAGDPLTFSTPLNDGADTYTFKVVEVQPAARHGWRFDKSEYHVTVTVAKNAAGQYEAKVTQVVQVKDRDGRDIAADKQQPADNLTAAFVNRYISVATLPAAGDLTGRQWLLIGGCFGLIAVVAGIIVSIWSGKKRLY